MTFTLPPSDPSSLGLDPRPLRLPHTKTDYRAFIRDGILDPLGLGDGLESRRAGTPGGGPSGTARAMAAFS